MTAERAADEPRRLRPAEVAERAAQQLGELRDRPIDGVAALERTDEGWQVLIELVEVPRVPSSTDVLAAYAVTVDDDGELVRYERVRRYRRAETGEEEL